MHHISLIKEQRRLREISAIKRPLRYQTECAVGCIVWKTFPSKHILIVSCQKRFFEKNFDSPIQSCIHAGFPSTDQTKVLRKKYYISKNRLNKIQPIFTNHIFSDNCFSFIMAFLLRCFHFITELS